MRRIFLLSLALLASGCTTPTTTLKHPKTKQIATCGGNVSSSLAGGAIGYHVQKSNDEDCVKNYQSQGFKVESVKTEE